VQEEIASSDARQRRSFSANCLDCAQTQCAQLGGPEPFHEVSQEIQFAVIFFARNQHNLQVGLKPCLNSFRYSFILKSSMNPTYSVQSCVSRALAGQMVTIMQLQNPNQYIGFDRMIFRPWPSEIQEKRSKVPLLLGFSRGLNSGGMSASYIRYIYVVG
jgi:hypothetical protein